MLISSSSKIHTFRKQKSPLLTSNELLLMLTKTNNQSKQKIKNIMTYKVYTHRCTHTHMYIYHCFILLSKSMSVSVLASTVQKFFAFLGDCGWLLGVVGGFTWLHILV